MTAIFLIAEEQQQQLLIRGSAHQLTMRLSKCQLRDLKRLIPQGAGVYKVIIVKANHVVVA